MSTQPIMAGVLAWFVLGEAVTTRDFISIIITLTAVYMIMSVQVKQDLELIQDDP
jgi:drug/metabolite transporter (DMT)-like permease